MEGGGLRVEGVRGGQGGFRGRGEKRVPHIAEHTCTPPPESSRVRGFKASLD